MRALASSALYWLVWLLFRPFDWVLKYRTAPINLRDSLKLDPTKPVVWVLSTRSWSDMFVLDRLCRDLHLPRPSRTGLNFPSVDKAGVVYLPALLETRMHATELTRLIETAIATHDYDAQVVTVSVFWGRDPGQETSLFKLLFADSVQAGAVQKLFIMLFNGRAVFMNFGLPFSFREFADKSGDAPSTMRKLTRVLHFHFLRARTAALGPTLLRRNVVVTGVLQHKSVRRAVEHVASVKGQSYEQTLRYARKCAEEIAADYTTAAINFLERFLGTIVWKRVFADIDLRGIEPVRELAQSHEIIYMPSHRSHADYLLMSYSLYHQ
ncbi:MAG TPA: glycerol-3-phosphate 1-O-acyltransferase, partial [Nevskiaceae bacterium]|nr:glycerol-3-phosphate 1-O-acyltransferase [Nevskiaceae bacterium]